MTRRETFGYDKDPFFPSSGTKGPFIVFLGMEEGAKPARVFRPGGLTPAFCAQLTIRAVWERVRASRILIHMLRCPCGHAPRKNRS